MRAYDPDRTSGLPPELEHWLLASPYETWELSFDSLCGQMAQEARMSGVKLFRKQDQDFRFEREEPFSILAFVNSGVTDTMGGGMGVFGAGSDVEWTVTYDELLFIHSGHFTLKVGEAVYRAGPGDTLWIPRDTPLSYVAEEDVWFFFAVYPASSSPSAGKAKRYPDAPPSEKDVRA